MSEMRMVMTTTENDADARRLAELVVGERLAGCVQLIPIHSTYRWEGEVIAEPEVLLVCKTTAARARDLADRIRAAHGYDVPEVVVAPVEWAAPAYLEWLATEVAES